MEKKQTPKKIKKTSNVIYHVSWGNDYTRQFNTEKEREYFITHYIGSVEHKTWESEVD
jgi:hypothetical protein